MEPGEKKEKKIHWDVTRRRAWGSRGESHAPLPGRGRCPCASRRRRGSKGQLCPPQSRLLRAPRPEPLSAAAAARVPEGTDGARGQGLSLSGAAAEDGSPAPCPSLASSASRHVLPSLFASAAPCQAATRCAVTPSWDFLLRFLLPAHPFCHCHRRVVILENRDTVISLS